MPLLTKISNILFPSRVTVTAYNRIAEKYAKTFSKTSQYIDNFLGHIPKGEKILDAGCGVGNDSTYMLSKGYEVLGVDLSEEMLKIANKKNPQNCFVIGDVRTLEFSKNSFGGIFASYSLIHLNKKEALSVIKKFYSQIKPEGILYISLQSGTSAEIFVSSPLDNSEKLFLSIFSPKEIEKILTNSGFTIIEQYIRKPKSNQEHNFEKLYIIAKK